MKGRIRRFARDLHRDESGPNTVEWVLLIIVALLVLLVIYFLVTKFTDKAKEDTDRVLEQDITTE